MSKRIWLWGAGAVVVVGVLVAGGLLGTAAYADHCHSGHKAAKAAAAKAVWTCPMHPAVHSAGAGKCSKCGMKLIAKKSAGKAQGCTRECRAKAAGAIESALKHVAAAEAAVKGGKKDAALKELAAARGLLDKLHKRIQHASAEAPKGIANARCPMMGSKLNPAKVPAELTRVFRGEKVGFCCGGCPVAWDKLSDNDKAAKLAKAK